jgi:hypothetical protein
MAEQASQYIQPSVFFAMSHPMVGSVIPGDLVRYNVRTVNYADLSHDELIRGKRTLFGSVVKPPNMNETHGGQSDVMKKLLAAIKGGKPAPHGLEGLDRGAKPGGAFGVIPKAPGPQLMEGYAPVTDDRSWRTV